MLPAAESEPAAGPATAKEKMQAKLKTTAGRAIYARRKAIAVMKTPEEIAKRREDPQVAGRLQAARPAGDSCRTVHAGHEVDANTAGAGPPGRVVVVDVDVAVPG